MIHELRMLIAEKLLYWATLIAPSGDDGNRLRRYILAYIQETVRAKNIKSLD